MLITLSSYISTKFIHVSYCMFKVNYRDRNPPAQRSELKAETRVNKKHTGTLLLFAKASAVKQHLCLCWTHTVALALRTVLDSRRYLSWKQSPVCLTLLLYACEWWGGHDLSLMISSTLYFPPAPCQSCKEPLGEQEPLVNQPLMWEPQSPRQQNCFSLILLVFELRNQSPWTCLLREPCCLPASDEKADQGGIKKGRDVCH